MLARFLAQPPHRKRLAFEALRLMAGYRLALAFLPSGTVLRRGEDAVARAREPADSRPDLLPDLQWALRAASRRVPGSRCLAQALAARTMYARRGLSSDLRFGGRKKEDGTFEAHAWLESRGTVVYGDDRSDLFTRIVDTGDAGPRTARDSGSP
jgi:hypothetical protein